MRLSKIKLAGFKSFVDPTEIVLSSNLVAILGPNGCGKSNTIDAVRWVMGESSAKNLRSGSITDVIFNGSTTRKPVGQCSVELIFDNTDGTLGGEYASYSEISIRRLVTRDGQSQYFLNGAKCRRKDITDIFLGTGLGPRSYAIIEQGMISRLIEAKPDDLRIFLEEAAGISKYKERRKETESRIGSTRENLARLEDLQSELDKQLRHLQRQSEAAKHYNDFKEREHTLKGELDAMNWRQLQTDALSLEEEIRQASTLLASAQAQISNAELVLEKERLRRIDVYDNHDAVQKEYYQLGTQIATVEQNLLHHQDKKQVLIDDVERVKQDLNESLKNFEEDNQKIQSIQAQLEVMEPAMHQAQVSVDEANEKLAECEDMLFDLREKLDDINQRSQAPSQSAEVEKSKITQLETYIRKTSERTQTLQKEKEGLNCDLLQRGIEENQNKITNVELNIENVQSKMDAIETELLSLKDDLDSKKQKQDELRSALQVDKGRLSALDALQQAAHSQDEQTLDTLLNEFQIQTKGKLFESIEVEPLYETALEVVLSSYLDAKSFANFADIKALLKDEEKFNQIPKGACFIAHEGLDTESLTHGVSQDLSLTPLADFCHNAELKSLLLNIYVCSDLNTALDNQSKLTGSQSIICPCGTWLGSHWIKLGNSENDAKSGLIARDKEIKSLREKIEQNQLRLIGIDAQVDVLRDSIKVCEENKAPLSKDKNEFERELREYVTQLSNRSARLEQMKTRVEAIDKELSLTDAEYLSMQDDIAKSRAALELALDQMSTFSEEKEQAVDELSDFEEQIRGYREKAKTAREVYHQHALKQQSLTSEINAIESNLKRSDAHIAQLKSREEQLKATLLNFDEPVIEIQAQLEAYLASRVTLEDRLTIAKQALGEVEALLQEEENRRQEASVDVERFRTRLENAKMQWQAIDVRKQMIEQTIIDDQKDIQTVLAGLPEGANEKEWAAELEELSVKIQKLGAINLAAIDEYGAALERKTYLDEQLGDLNEALAVLEGAIATIDEETRLRFEETFNIVNDHFKSLFPRLFGGGQALLELTGDDLLSTGVQVIARPPGKKNSSISMLSGGEKALTAVAMVFSIFQLNPAPFCMLDEVDAPLDDTNVARYCALVKEMSKTVQFIFISHNKLTMEMADYLLGVTMREPGVSRLVSVNMEEAASLAEA